MPLLEYCIHSFIHSSNQATLIEHLLCFRRYTQCLVDWNKSLAFRNLTVRRRQTSKQTVIMQNVETVMEDFRMWDGSAEKGPWTRPKETSGRKLCWVGFWRVTWSYLIQKKSWYYLSISEYFPPPFSHQFWVKHVFRRKETSMNKCPLWLLTYKRIFSISGLQTGGHTQIVFNGLEER